MNTSLKACPTVAILAILSFMAMPPRAGASSGELGLRAVIVHRNSVLGISKLRQESKFSLRQTRNFHISHTRKLFRCGTVDCETAGAITIRVVTTTTNELSIYASGDNRFDASSKPYLSPLTIIVSYE